MGKRKRLKKAIDGSPLKDDIYEANDILNKFGCPSGKAPKLKPGRTPSEGRKNSAAWMREMLKEARELAEWKRNAPAEAVLAHERLLFLVGLLDEKRPRT